MMRKLLNVLPVLAVLGALWLAHREVAAYSAAELSALAFSFPWTVLSLAVCLTAVGYVLLAGYDWIALRHLGKSLPLHQVLLAGFSSFAVSNSVGHAMVSGGSLRYRFYSGWGLGGLEIAQVILLSTITYFLAIGALLVASYWLTPVDNFGARHLAGGSLRAIVALCALLLAAYAFHVFRGRREISWRGHVIQLPGPGITLMQLVVGMCDLLLAALVLFVLLQHYVDIPFALFLNAYLLAQVLGLFSQSPGGIGVFEGVFLFLLGENQPSAHVMAALIAYRAIYYILPLLVASLLVVLHEFLRQDRLMKMAMVPWLAMQQTLPYLYSVLMLVGGGMLLVSANTPAQADRLDWLGDMLPVSLIEVSHLLATLCGLLMLVMARAVRLKLRAAYFVALGLLAIGMVTCLLKGVDYEEATVLSLLFLLLLPAKSIFYRLSRLDEAGLPAKWVLLIAVIMIFSIWVGLFSYRDVPYAHELWWQVDLHGNPSRFLRSMLVALILFCSIYSFYFLRRSRYKPGLPDEAELTQAEHCVMSSEDSSHWLALTGDKHLFWDDKKTGFISYVPTEKYWIAMGDPCGPASVRDELLWRFREASDRFGAKPVFYRVKPANLSLYLDLGMTLVKLGEEAVVELDGFSLSGNARASLRHSYNKITREGWVFHVVPRSEVPPILDELERISNQWLTLKNTREKGLSLGFFDRRYLMRSDIAVLSRNGIVVAFANLWRTETCKELSIDLMRYGDDAPSGAMEFLMISLMLWAREQGYLRFNLGMAPLAGLEYRTLAPLWHKFGHSVFRYGNEFYNFQGLRSYKDKFGPQWVPMYLAVPSTFDVPSVLLQVSARIAGGVSGIFSK